MPVKLGKSVKAPAVTDDRILLELAPPLQRYHDGGVTYETGTAYRFTRDQAINLLDRRIGSQIVWKRYRPAEEEEVVVVKPASKKIVDASENKVQAPVVNEIEEATKEAKPVELGNEEEIAELENQLLDNEDNQSV